MEIIWLGHACFRLRTNDLVVVTDPFPDSIGLQMGSVRGLAVTVSHQHDNHNHWQGVEGNPRVLSGPGEYEMSGIYVTGVMTPRSTNDPEDKRNTAYLIEMESLRLCHLGGISSTLSTRQIEELAPVDILFVPSGGVRTIEVPQAIQLMQSLEPKVVIPMLYGLPDLTVGLGGLDALLREMGLRDVQPQARLNISASSLPQEMQVVVLQPQGARAQR